MKIHSGRSSLTAVVKPARIWAGLFEIRASAERKRFPAGGFFKVHTGFTASAGL
jgi:hypothetical protein